MPKITKVWPQGKWGGGVEWRARTETGETVLIRDPEAVAALLVESINSKEYTLERNEREQYRRLQLV